MYEYQGHSRMELVSSDNGMNFVLANKLLNCDVSKRVLETNKICEAIASKNIRWYFKPHFGGLWEATAGVYFMKQHLIKIIGKAKLSYEEFFTVLAQF